MNQIALWPECQPARRCVEPSDCNHRPRFKLSTLLILEALNYDVQLEQLRLGRMKTDGASLPGKRVFAEALA